MTIRRLLLISVLAGIPGVCLSDELVVVSSANMRTFFPKITKGFEDATGHHLKLEYAEALPTRDRGLAAPFDVFIDLSILVDDVVRAGKAIGPTKRDIARSTVVVVVKSGADKPDIATGDAFKDALLRAKSVAYTDPAAGGASGLAMADLLNRMGIATEISRKASLTPGSAAFVPLVASGKVEIGITQTAIAKGQAGVEIVGGIPKELNGDLVYSAVAGPNARPGASDLLAYLGTEKAKAAFADAGFDP